MATPQEAFHEAANIAKGYFPVPDATVEGFAEAFGYKLWNVGGGNKVALKYVDDRHVISVDPEFTCLFETEKSGNCAEGIFQMAEDPWLVSGNLDDEVHEAHIKRSGEVTLDGEKIGSVHSVDRLATAVTADGRVLFTNGHSKGTGVSALVADKLGKGKRWQYKQTAANPRGGPWTIA